MGITWSTELRTEEHISTKSKTSTPQIYGEVLGEVSLRFDSSLLARCVRYYKEAKL